MYSKRVSKLQSPDDSFINPGFKKNLFPPIYNVNQLPLNEKLKPLGIISTKVNRTSDALNISFELLLNNSTADVFLYQNNVKKDMFYSITSGEYTFRNIMLTAGKNVIELFYTTRMSRSSSVFIKKICRRP